MYKDNGTIIRCIIYCYGTKRADTVELLRVRGRACVGCVRLAQSGELISTANEFSKNKYLDFFFFFQITEDNVTRVFVDYDRINFDATTIVKSIFLSAIVLRRWPVSLVRLSFGRIAARAFMEYDFRRVKC